MNEASDNQSTHWRSQTDSDGIVWLCLDKADSKVNVLSAEVLREFDSHLTRMESDPPRGLVIYSGKQSGFVMGADINEIQAIETPEQSFELVRLGQKMFDRLETLRCPSVAVFNGFALGGGLELAMACRYRLALEGKKSTIGLPEVQLGVHPGFGGTVRAVQIMGVRAGMQLMLTGKPIRVEKALKQQLIDRIATHDNWKQAAKEMLASGKPKNDAPLLDKLMNLFFIRPLVANALVKQVRSKARPEHYPAPFAMIELWKKHGASGQAAYRAEAKSFSKLVVGSTSRNLVRVYFLQNRLKSQGGKTKQRVEHVHVVGAGVMGGDIAAWCALRGMNVTLQDREQKYIEPALARAAKLFSKRIRDENDRQATTQRLNADVEGSGAAQADLIIEAIYENLEAKQALYEKLQAAMKPGAVLATNTSSIQLEDLRTVLKEPTRFIGLHFFNPVAKLPLVEVIRCKDTEQSVLDLGFAFVKQIGKNPLECASSPGFVVNRVLAPYMAEAMYLADSGVPLKAIDQAAERFGMPMGPIELIDSVGLDVALHVSNVLGSAYGRPVPESLKAKVEQKQFGRKSGQGYYQWQDGRAVKPDDGGGSVPADITDRLILPMVNESVACLDEEVVSDADLLDAGVIFGTGFAPFRGGPIQYARDEGIDAVVKRLETLASTTTLGDGGRFNPHPGWATLSPGEIR